MKHRHRTFAPVVLLAALVLCACAARVKTVTNLPLSVTVTQVQSWDTAVADLDKFSQAVSAAQSAVLQLHQQGVFPDGPEYIATLNGFGRAAQVRIEAANFLKGVPNDWSQNTQQTFASYAAQIAQALEDIVKTGTVGIKNANSQQQIVQLVSNAAAILQITLSLTS